MVTNTEAAVKGTGHTPVKGTANTPVSVKGTANTPAQGSAEATVSKTPTVGTGDKSPPLRRFFKKTMRIVFYNLIQIKINCYA